MTKTRLSALAVPGFSNYALQLGLVALLLMELLYLTITFDTQGLHGAPSVWVRVIDQAPQYLRLAITIALATLLLAGRELSVRIRDLGSRTALTSRLPFLTVHVCALLAFILLTGMILGGQVSFGAHPAPWTLMWLLAGITTFAAWSLTLFPRQAWLSAARRGHNSIGWGVAIGTTVWASSFLTEQFWRPLAVYTFGVVGWMLGLVYPTIISNPAKLVIGTPTFRVSISPECSGYEGVGLILAFLTVYLYLFRKDLRFPGALTLLPLGAAAIWILNAVRIAALVMIGTSGWPAIAQGGFHSQAGWLAFNAVGLGFVAITNQGRYFMTTAPRRSSVDTALEATPAYLAPFMAVLATAMVTGAFSAGFDWLYPLRVLVVGAVLWVFRKHYANLGWTPSWSAIAIGFLTFAIWLALVPHGVRDKDGWPAALGSVPSYWAALWLLFRVVGYIVTVPLAEELAFRGFLTRRIIHADFEKLPIGTFSWVSFLLSSVLFGAFHGRLWLAGTIAGMSFAFALYRRRSFGDAVQAHATTNGLIALYAITTGRWSVWS